MLLRVNGLPTDQSFGEHVPCGSLKLRWSLTAYGLRLRLEVEAEVAASALDHETLVLAGSAQHHFRWPQGRVPADEIVGERGSFDPRSRRTKTVGEEAQGARNGSPAPGHGCLGYPGFLTVHGSFVDH